MEGLILGAMVLVLLSLTGLILVGGRALKEGQAGSQENLPPRWPPLALLVPVTGASPGLAARLQSLLAQDYPDYQVIFVTRDSEDPAYPVIRALISEHPQARQVESGQAVACGQKNHNLLAGLQVVGEAPEILAFCDSNQLAQPTFLKALVEPIARGEAAVTSGYHHIIPQNGGMVALGRAITVLSLYLTKHFSRLNQPWGGATAVKRRVFAHLQVEKLWAENVVDDVSLAACLRRAGILVREAPGACLATPLAGETLVGWSHWLTRQWLYLKFIMPGTWLVAGLFQHLLTGLVLLAGCRCLLAPLGWISLAPALAALSFLGLLTGLGITMRPLHPSPGPLKLWLPAFYAAIFMASWCHLRTWFSREIHWRGISYRVTWKGRVIEVRGG